MTIYSGLALNGVSSRAPHMAQHPMPRTTLLTTKAHGSVMEGLLILLPCQAKTFRLQVAVVVRLITCQEAHRGWMLKPKSKQQKKGLMSNLPRYFRKHHELLGMSLIRF